MHYLQSFGRDIKKIEEIVLAGALHHARDMDAPEFDRLLARVRNPRLIPGIYNYCDGRCPRCPFTDRCLTYLDQEDTAAGDGDHHVSFAQKVTQSVQRTLDMLAEVGQREGIDLTSLHADDPDEKKIEQALGRHYDDPIVAQSRAYTHLVWPIVKALAPVVIARGDPLVIDAVETIEWFSTFISSKIFRAVAGQAEMSRDRDDDGQPDHDGSAKIALLGIAESRAAWRILMESGKATADGVPAQAVRMLDALDTSVRAHFPNAMAFIRPGFDDGTL